MIEISFDKRLGIDGLNMKVNPYKFEFYTARQ